MRERWRIGADFKLSKHAEKNYLDLFQILIDNQRLLLEALLDIKEISEKAFHRLTKPYMMKCAQCGRTKRLRIRFPRRKQKFKLKDSQILCSYCMQVSISGHGVNGNQVNEICNRYLAGEKVGRLAKEYGIHRVTLGDILRREGIMQKKKEIQEEKNADKK